MRYCRINLAPRVGNLAVESEACFSENYKGVDKKDFRLSMAFGFSLRASHTVRGENRSPHYFRKERD